MMEATRPAATMPRGRLDAKIRVIGAGAAERVEISPLADLRSLHVQLDAWCLQAAAAQSIPLSITSPPSTLMRFISAALAGMLIGTAGCEDLLDVDHHPVTGEWRGQYTSAGQPTFLDVTLVERNGGQLSGVITISGSADASWAQDSIVGTNRKLCVTLRSARDSRVYFRGSLANPTWIEGHFDPGGLHAPMALASSPGPAFDPTGPVEDHCD